MTQVLQCHGSFATASCIECRATVPGKAIEDDILRQRIPYCKLCAAQQAKLAAAKKPKRPHKKKSWNGGESSEDEFQAPKGVMKPDITFFGEKLDDKFDRSLEADREKVDLLIVIGTSLKVAPVADMILHIPHSVPQVTGWELYPRDTLSDPFDADLDQQDAREAHKPRRASATISIRCD